MQRILVVEDEMQIARTLRDYLEVAGFDVTVVGDGSAALASARGDRPDLVVLDLGLPGMDGLDVASELRRTSTTPIVMLTARGEESDRIVGLELGADDYVVKPFSGPEVIARMRAVLRRVQPAEPATPEAPITIGGLHVDLAARRATLEGQELQLSRKEFDLLAELVRNAGKVVTREDLMDRVWDENWFGSTKTLDVHVRWLRGKLGETADNATYLQTVRGVGFRFRAPDK